MRVLYLEGSCDTLVNDNAARGSRPKLIADTVFTDGKAGKSLGRPIVVFFKPEGRSLTPDLHGEQGACDVGGDGEHRLHPGGAGPSLRAKASALSPFNRAAVICYEISAAPFSGGRDAVT